MITQVIPSVPLLACYTIDIDALLARVATLSFFDSRKDSPPARTSASRAPSVQEQLERLRGRQLHAATDEQLLQLIGEIFAQGNIDLVQASVDPAFDLVPEAARRLRLAAALHNAAAPQHLSDDLAAACDAMRSSMCVLSF